MTAQIPDTAIYDGSEWDIIGLRGSGLPVPQDFGMEPQAPHTACWRGFHARYKITESMLILDEMTVYGLEEPAPDVNEVSPTPGCIGSSVYQQIGLSIPFTGRLRLARDFIDAMYVHMGFQMPSAYRRVVDLSFDSGKLIGVNDRSEEAEMIRSRLGDRPVDQDMLQWIEKRFSMDIDDFE